MHDVSKKFVISLIISTMYLIKKNSTYISVHFDKILFSFVNIENMLFAI